MTQLTLRVRDRRGLVDAPFIGWDPMRDTASVSLEGKVVTTSLSAALALTEDRCRDIRSRPDLLTPEQAVALARACLDYRRPDPPCPSFRPMIHALLDCAANHLHATPLLRRQCAALRGYGSLTAKKAPPARQPSGAKPSGRKGKKKNKRALPPKPSRAPAMTPDAVAAEMQAMYERQALASRRWADRRLRDTAGWPSPYEAVDPREARAHREAEVRREAEQARRDSISALVSRQQGDVVAVAARAACRRLAFTSATLGRPQSLRVLLCGRVVDARPCEWLVGRDEIRIQAEGHELFVSVGEALLRNQAWCAKLATLVGRWGADEAFALYAVCVRNADVMGHSTATLLNTLAAFGERARRSRTLDDRARDALRALEPLFERHRTRYAERYGAPVERQPMRPDWWAVIQSARVSQRPVRSALATVGTYRRYEWAKDTWVDDRGVVHGTYSYNPSDFK